MDESSSSESAAPAAAEPVTRFRAWRMRRGLSVHAAAAQLGIPYSVVRAVDLGTSVPTGETCARFVFGSGGELELEDLLPSKLRYQLKRQYQYAGRRRGPAERVARAS